MRRLLSFTFIDNVIMANELAAITSWQTIIERLKQYASEIHLEKEPDQIFNIAFGGNTTLNQLFTALRDYLARYDQALTQIEPIYGPNRDGDIPHSQASTKKACTIFNYEPAIDARQGFEIVAGLYFKNFQKLMH